MLQQKQEDASVFRLTLNAQAERRAFDYTKLTMPIFSPAGLDLWTGVYCNFFTEKSIALDANLRKKYYSFVTD